VVSEVRGELTVSKQAAQEFDVERFNVRKLSELEVRKQYQIGISKRFAALENLNDGENINMTWENINPLKAELSSNCHLPALLGARHILHVSRIRVKGNNKTSAKESLGLYELKQ
jgi:hypothetical protein